MLYYSVPLYKLYTRNNNIMKLHQIFPYLITFLPLVFVWFNSLNHNCFKQYWHGKGSNPLTLTYLKLFCRIATSVSRVCILSGKVVWVIGEFLFQLLTSLKTSRRTDKYFSNKSRKPLIIKYKLQVTYSKCTYITQIFFNKQYAPSKMQHVLIGFLK